MLFVIRHSNGFGPDTWADTATSSFVADLWPIKLQLALQAVGLAWPFVSSSYQIPTDLNVANSVSR